MYFCLQLDKIVYISYKEFETLKLLPETDRFDYCINSLVFKYFNVQCQNYLNGVFETAPGNILKLDEFSRN